MPARGARRREDQFAEPVRAVEPANGTRLADRAATAHAPVGVDLPGKRSLRNQLGPPRASPTENGIRGPRLMVDSEGAIQNRGIAEDGDDGGDRRTKMSRTVRWLVFAIVLLVSALYTAKGLKRGWFPWDEGVLAQSAEAVLHGELP